MDFLNLKEKRYDAANTLVVPYDATPDMVDTAYERRLRQRFELQNSDFQAFMRGNDALYDARVRMSLPESKQWLAQLRLLATGGAYKAHTTMLYLLKLWRGKFKSVLCQTMADGLISDAKKMYRRYKILRGIYIYDIAGLWGMFAYNRLATETNPVVPIIVCGSTIIITAVGVPVVYSLISKKARDLIINFDLMTKTVGAMDAELYAVDQEINNGLATLDKMRQEIQDGYQKKYNDISDMIIKNADKQK